jgi:hypothetical protein
MADWTAYLRWRPAFAEAMDARLAESRPGWVRPLRPVGFEPHQLAIRKIGKGIDARAPRSPSDSTFSHRRLSIRSACRRGSGPLSAIRQAHK